MLGISFLTIPTPRKSVSLNAPVNIVMKFEACFAF